MVDATKWYLLRRARSRPASIVYPVCKRLPTISGVRTNGATIIVSPGLWHYGTVDQHQWMRDGANISGETNTTYTYVSSTDDTHDITVKERATSGAGSSFAISGKL